MQFSVAEASYFFSNQTKLCVYCIYTRQNQFTRFPYYSPSDTWVKTYSDPFSPQYLSSNMTNNMHITYMLCFFLYLITFYSHLDWMSVIHYNHFIDHIFIDYLEYKIYILCSHCIDNLLVRSFCWPYKNIISPYDLFFCSAIKRSTLLSVSLTDCLQSCCTWWRHIMWLSAHRLSVCFMCVPAAH